MLEVYVAFVLFIGINAKFVPEKHRNWDLLPHDICGLTTSYRVIGGWETSLNAYPWTVRIGTVHKSGVHYSCGGVLVNSNTVLTAAHCLQLDNKKTIGPIRLGEHDTETDPDCESGFCADPVTDVAPSIIIVPKELDSSIFHNDFAIVKLKKKVTFSESIRPICIGNEKFFSQDFAGRMTEVVGWGYNNVERKRRSKKLEVVKIPVLPHEKCKTMYQLKLNISYSQICAGGEAGVDACNGDSGGPLMIVDDVADRARYYLLGIVSFGPLNCGNPHYPGIYTNLTTFIEWFMDNLDGAGSNAKKIYL